jgi:hypothetical protein
VFADIRVVEQIAFFKVSVRFDFSGYSRKRLVYPGSYFPEAAALFQSFLNG